MSSVNLKIAGSHIRFDWLKALGLPRQIPYTVANKIMALRTPAEVEGWMVQAKLGTKVRVGEKTGSVYLAEIYHPELGGKPRPHTINVFLSQEITGSVPPGSAIVKYDLPETEKTEEGEKHFRRFQAIVSLLCQNLFRSIPFAGLIGYNTEDLDRTSLSLRGINLFFTSHPDDLFAKIRNILSVEVRLREEEARSSQKHYPAHANLIMEMKSELEQARHTLTGENISLLSTVYSFVSDNTLVDLR